MFFLNSLTTCLYWHKKLVLIVSDRYLRSCSLSSSLQLITRQFVPMSGTFIFNGIDHKSQLLSL